MRSLLFYVNVIALILLTLLTLASVVFTLNIYTKHGFTYEVTTIIGDENTTRTATLWENIATSVLLFFLLGLLLFNTLVISAKKQQLPFV